MINRKILIKDHINKFKNKEISLSELVEGLDSLLPGIGEEDSLLKNKLFKEWFTLEELNSLTLDEERTNLDNHEKDILRKTLNNIIHILQI